ncbi:MAG: radical SAM/Cys-rich protein [Candidatus Omnitrophota bacterium]|jgi:radical SAM/Cys-rich protein
MNAFDQKTNAVLGHPLIKNKIEVLQVNVGKLCNLACVHCHVEAGPTKTKENMDRATADAIVRLMDMPDITTVDITGGAPEMNPHFKYLVDEAVKRGLQVIDRCNLTVFFLDGMQDMPQYLADKGVMIVASMPCYSKDNVDKQRGNGTFDESIKGLQILNQLGYAQSGSKLELNLVYNPVGPHLPPNQVKLEADYKQKLQEDFNIQFNQLFTITNMAIKRYAKYLKAFGQLEDYEVLLEDNFNQATLDSLMCLNTLSISWDGLLYDCDFNQMLNMSMGNGTPLNVTDFKPSDLSNWQIKTAKHCFGCTAGAGSSCQGALEN